MTTRYPSARAAAHYAEAGNPHEDQERDCDDQQR